MPALPIVEVTLASIRCVTMSERDGDEIYVLFDLDPAEAPTGKRGSLAHERVPANMEAWKMVNGSLVQPRHTLYVGELDRPLRFSVTVMEMDILEIVKNSLSIVGGWVDDFVGRIVLQIGADGALRWQLDRHTHAEPMHEGLYSFRLTGNRSEYHVQLGVRLS